MAEPGPPSTLGAALWSINVHSMFRGGFGPSPVIEELRPQALPDALRMLLLEDDRHARTRKRRALMQMCSADMYRAESLRPIYPDDAGARIRTALLEMTEALELDSAKLDAYEPEVAGEIVAQGGATDPTKVVAVQCKVCVDGMKMRVKLTSKARVKRPFAELKMSMDPQSWDKCPDSVFVETLKEKLLPDGSWAADPVTPGLSWPGDQFGYFYEHVGAGMSVVQNRLRAKVEVTADTTQCDFWLAESIYTSIGGIGGPGGMQKDEGYVRCEPNVNHPQWSNITMEKTVKFSTEAMMYLAVPALCLWGDEATQVVPHC